MKNNEEVTFKLLLSTFKALHHLAPSYIFYLHTLLLTHSDLLIFSIPRSNCKTKGEHARSGGVLRRRPLRFSAIVGTHWTR